MSFLVLQAQGKHFMLIADRINHFGTCTVTLLAEFLSNNFNKIRGCASAHAWAHVCVVAVVSSCKSEAQQVLTYSWLQVISSFTCVPFS
jgi:hypothetical protein